MDTEALLEDNSEIIFEGDPLFEEELGPVDVVLVTALDTLRHFLLRHKSSLFSCVFLASLQGSQGLGLAPLNLQTFL